MNCDEARSLLSGLLDDELDRGVRAEVQSHLETCASCSEAIDDMRKVGEAIRAAAPLFTAPAHLRDGVRFALRGAQVLERKKRASQWRSWGALAAGIMIFAALGSAPFLVNARNQRRALAEEVVSAHQRAGSAMRLAASCRRNRLCTSGNWALPPRRIASRYSRARGWPPTSS